jgi:hypothetical protein
MPNNLFYRHSSHLLCSHIKYLHANVYLFTAATISVFNTLHGVFPLISPEKKCKAAMLQMVMLQPFSHQFIPRPFSGIYEVMLDAIFVLFKFPKVGYLFIHRSDISNPRRLPM